MTREKINSEASEVILDVRPIFERGGSPCEAIDETVATLKEGQVFVLLVPFEPRPLFAKLGRQGFSHSAKQMPDRSWRIEFRQTKQQWVDPKPLNGERDGIVCAEGDIRLDARGLEPPEPLVLTLEAAQKLTKGRKLFMHSDRKPMHLLVQLEERKLNYDCTEQPDRSFITEIWIP